MNVPRVTRVPHVMVQDTLLALGLTPRKLPGETEAARLQSAPGSKTGLNAHLTSQIGPK